VRDSYNPKDDDIATGKFQLIINQGGGELVSWTLIYEMKVSRHDSEYEQCCSCGMLAAQTSNCS